MGEEVKASTVPSYAERSIYFPRQSYPLEGSMTRGKTQQTARQVIPQPGKRLEFNGEINTSL
jgi:hypothetical protein